MAIGTEPSTIGVEEEYLLVDLESRDLSVDPPQAFMAACRDLLGDRVTPELLRCQIEVGTPVCATVADARKELAFYRSTICAEARRHGLGLMAASTHPFADWSEQMTTDKERYAKLTADLQTVAQRMLICGMHVHVASPMTTFVSICMASSCTSFRTSWRFRRPRPSGAAEAPG
jgi:carboxylate-amine ligase